MKPDFQAEVEKFRAWATTNDQQDIEWEREYDEEKWEAVYLSVGDFLKASMPSQWTKPEIEDLLYLLVRDTVWAEVAACVQRNPRAAVYLAAQSLSLPDVDPVSRYELARILGRLPPDSQVEALLMRFADDETEYVRRMALQSLAIIGSSETEAVALREWHRDSSSQLPVIIGNERHPIQQWSRMNALACWHHVHSPLLEAHLIEAEASSWPYLADFARRLRLGEVAPLA